MGPRAPAGAIERTRLAAALPRIGGPLRALNGCGHDLRTRLTRAPLLDASRRAREKDAKVSARGARPIARVPTLAPGSPRATPAAQTLERRVRADHAVARRPTAARTVRRDPPRARPFLSTPAARAAPSGRGHAGRSPPAPTLSTLVGRARWKYARAPHVSQAVDFRVGIQARAHEESNELAAERRDDCRDHACCARFQDERPRRSRRRPPAAPTWPRGGTRRSGSSVRVTLRGVVETAVSW